MNVLLLEDAVEAPPLRDLSADLLGLGAESWSLSVSPDFCRRHDRHTVKRQDVIYGETRPSVSSYFPCSPGHVEILGKLKISAPESPERIIFFIFILLSTFQISPV